MPAPPKSSPRRAVHHAYRHAVILSAVVAATVTGIVLVDPYVARAGRPALLQPGSGDPAVTVVEPGSAPWRDSIAQAPGDTWYADQSAAGVRPDASH